MLLSGPAEWSLSVLCHTSMQYLSQQAALMLLSDQINWCFFHTSVSLQFFICLSVCLSSAMPTDTGGDVFPHFHILGINYDLDWCSFFMPLHHSICHILSLLSASVSFAFYHPCYFQIFQFNSSHDVPYESGLSFPELSLLPLSDPFVWYS